MITAYLLCCGQLLRLTIEKSHLNLEEVQKDKENQGDLEEDKECRSPVQYGQELQDWCYIQNAQQEEDETGYQETEGENHLLLPRQVCGRAV